MFLTEMPFSTNFIFVKCRFPPNVQKTVVNGVKGDFETSLIHVICNQQINNSSKYK